MSLKRLAFALFVLAWIVALTYSVTVGGTSPERLDDSTARTVETNCRDARRDLARLPALGPRATPVDGAARLERENEIITQHQGLAQEEANLRYWFTQILDTEADAIELPFISVNCSIKNCVAGGEPSEFTSVMPP